MYKPIRQGDVILTPLPDRLQVQQTNRKLPHLTLAEGEATGHRHRISAGNAELYEENGILYLRVLSETALLSHEEHQAIPIPQGDWMIRIQREYDPDLQRALGLEEVWRDVID